MIGLGCVDITGDQMGERKSTYAGISYSEVESKRFGFRVHRGTLNQFNDKAFLAYLLDQDVDLAILRFPSDNITEIAKLERLGIPYIAADTLVHYETDLSRHEVPSLKNKNLEFVPLTHELVPHLERLIDEAFAEYSCHYAANPYLARKDWLEGYKEWARGYSAQSGEGKLSWIVRKDDRFVAFLTCSYSGDECEGVLYAVAAEMAGHGIYGDLIRFSQSYFKERGFRRMKVSTQIQNRAVQKVWAREGFSMSASYLTVHLNAFTNHSVVDKVAIPISFTREQVEKFASFTGDTNPLHVDGEFAKGMGFSGVILHGIIANAVMSKYFGTEVPGAGTLFSSYQYKFLAPLYPDCEYQANVSFYSIDKVRGIHKAFLRVVSPEGHACVFAHHVLVHK